MAKDAGVMPAARVPRTRGDGPTLFNPVLSAAGVFPAHAGMDRDGAWDKPTMEKCSPHTRGWTTMELFQDFSNSVFPAHAGMDRVPRRAATPSP